MSRRQGLEHRPTVAVVGMGYVGSSTSVCLAEKFHVVGVDVDESRIAMLNRGSSTVQEAGLQPLLRRGLRNGRLTFTSSYREVDASTIFLTVGTPSLPNNEADLSQVEAAATELGRHVLRRQNVLVAVRSTVPPGTTRKVVKPLLERYSGKTSGRDFRLAFSPEFLQEGSAIEDTHHPNRLVVGADDPLSMRSLIGFYRSYYVNVRPPLYRLSTESAELVKYASNAFLALKVSYINVISRITEQLPDADIDRVAEAIGADPRIGKRFLEAGPGFGGSCFPKDVSALEAYAKKLGVDSSLFTRTLAINSEQISHVIEMGGSDYSKKTVAVLGLAFKPHTNDIRASPGLELVSRLLRKGGNVRVFDPQAMSSAGKLLGQQTYYAETVQDCLKGADICFIMTGWPEFKKLSPLDTKSMRTKLIVDTRRVSRVLGKSKAIDWRAVGMSRMFGGPK